MNVILTASTFAILADPYLLYDQPVIRINLGIEYSKVFQCRLDQVRDTPLPSIRLYLSLSSPYLRPRQVRPPFSPLSI